jgi:hypothetical protein
MDRRQPHPSSWTPAATISLSSERGRVGDDTLCWERWGEASGVRMVSNRGRWARLGSLYCGMGSVLRARAWTRLAKRGGVLMRRRGLSAVVQARSSIACGNGWNWVRFSAGAQGFGHGHGT